MPWSRPRASWRSTSSSTGARSAGSRTRRLSRPTSSPTSPWRPCAGTPRARSMPDPTDAMDRGDRDALERYYEGLTPEERRARVILEPAYREVYNEVTQAHRSIDQPAYFWERWVPVLGPFPSMLYMKLRQHCYYRPGTPDHRDICWPKQETLAREIGLRDRSSIRRPLEILEKHGFIQRKVSYRTDPGTRRASRGTDRYVVFYELPLRPEDAAQLLILHSRRTPLEIDFHVGVRPTHENAPATGTVPVNDAPSTPRATERPSYPPKSPLHVLVRPTHGSHRGVLPTHLAVGDTHTSSCGRDPHISLWVGPTAELNGNEKKRSTFSGRQHQHMDPEAIEDLAFEITEDLQDPSSLRFFRLVATRLPHPRVRMILSETRSARAEGRITKTAGAYFTAAVKQLAQELGIDLGLGTSRAGCGAAE